MMYKKRRSDNVVINTDDFEEYRLRRETVKANMRDKQELKKAKNDLANLHGEMAEIKNMLQQLLERKNV